MHKHSKYHLSMVIVSLIVAFGVGFGLLVWRGQHASPVKNEVKTTPVKSESQVKKDETVAKTVIVQLPNAAPIEARVEDYNKPGSLWVVVSKDYPLADLHYRPSDLTLTDLPARTDKSVDEKSVSAVVVPDLTSMFTDAKNAGNDIMIASGFRSYELQQTYFSNYSKSYGEEAANKFSAKPGQSEHQTGLALDIAYNNRDCYLDVCFGQKPAGMWLAENAYKYGFILRYPSDKTEITKYQYEPWHFRYVGKSLAKALHESGLTLDEARPYLETARNELILQHKI